MSGKPPVDPAAAEYIRANRGKYPDEAIRRSLLASGHAPAAVDAAFASLGPAAQKPSSPPVSGGLRTYAGLLFLAGIVFIGVRAGLKLLSGPVRASASWAGELAGYSPARYAGLERLDALLPEQTEPGDAAEEFLAVARDWFESSRDSGAARPPDMTLLSRAALKADCRLLGARWTPEHWTALILMQGLAGQLEKAVAALQDRAEARAAAGDGAGAEKDFRSAAALCAHMLGSWSPVMRYAGGAGVVSTGLKMIRAFNWGVESPERKALGFLFKDVRANLPEADVLDAIAAAAKEPSEIAGIEAFFRVPKDRETYLVWALDSVLLSLSDAELSRRALARERRGFLEAWARDADPRTAALGRGYLAAADAMEREMRQSRMPIERWADGVARMDGRLRAGVDRYKTKF